MNTVRIVLDLVLAFLLLATGGGKLIGAASSHAIRDSLAVPPGRWKLIGMLEMLGVLGLVAGIWLPVAGLAAAIGVALLMVGAVTVRLRAGDGQTSGIIADVVLLVIAFLTAFLNASAM